MSNRVSHHCVKRILVLLEFLMYVVYLVTSYLSRSYFVSSYFIPVVSSQSFHLSFHQILSHCISFHLISIIPSYLIISHFIPSHLISAPHITSHHIPHISQVRLCSVPSTPPCNYTACIHIHIHSCPLLFPSIDLFHSVPFSSVICCAVL